DIANATRKAKKLLDIAQAVEQAASSVQAGLRVYESYTKGELSYGNIFDVVQAGLGIRKAAKVALAKRGAPRPPKADASFDPPCPVELFAVESCVAPGTPVITANGQPRAIEALRVGDRVAATNVNLDEPEGSTTFDDLEWHLVRLQMSNPDDPGDVYEIETLRPLAWIVEHEAYTGRTITLQTDRSPTDQACVLALERIPKITSGPGRVVLSTFAHRDQIVTVRFDGVGDPLETSPSHRLFSIDRNDWVQVSDLRAGDHLRTRNGKVTIASIETREVARVFDISVESDHSYFIDGTEVLSHNAGKKKPCPGAKKWMVGPYDKMRKLVIGTDLDAHHIGQKAVMKKLLKKNYDEMTGPSILVPKVGHTVKGPRGIVSRSRKGFKSVQQLLDRDYSELKRVYQKVPSSSLAKLTKLHKQNYPQAFKAAKKKK
ncbi:MAG TPA: Hint domain-containing protein, partial [Rhodothermia bacterium]